MDHTEGSVLVVEDVEEDIDRICDYLRVRGDSFDVARNVPEAIALLNLKRYRKVLLDVVIGGNINGARLVLEALKARNPDCRVLIVSAAGETAAVQRLRTEQLVDGVITKTMMMDLVAVISKFLDAPSSVNADGLQATSGQMQKVSAPRSKRSQESGRIGNEKQRAIGPLGYATITGVGLFIGVSMLFLLIGFASSMPADGTADRVYYLTLVILGLAGAAFLFGTMRSYASFKGKVLSGSLQLGGPAAVAALVVVGGFLLAPRSSTFMVTVRVTDDEGQAIRSGSVMLVAEAATMIAPINSNGEADFRELPAKLRVAPARIVADVPGYTQKKSEFKLESVVRITLARRPVPPPK